MSVKKRHILLVCFCVLLAGIPVFVVRNDFSQKSFDTSAVAKKMAPTEFKEKSAYFQEKLAHEEVTSVFRDLEEQAARDAAIARECHPFLHHIGHAAFKKYGTFEAAMSYQNGLCNSGYTHGVIEAAFLATDDPQQTITATCTSGTDFYAWQCFHGLGHGAMLVSNRSVEKSIELCRELGAEFESRACINGVFMERFLSIDHTGKVRNDDTDAAQVCVEQDSQDKPDCYFYAPTYFLGHNLDNYSGAAEWCTTRLKEHVFTCVSGVGAQTMKENVTNPSLAMGFCDTQGRYADVCASGAINILINHHASSSKVAEQCNSSLQKFKDVCIETVSRARTTFRI